jgi:hypothetical protein
MALAFKKILSNQWLLVFLSFVILEVISIFVFPFLWLERVFFVISIIIAATLTICRSEYGVYLLLAELVVGGLGYLVFFPLPADDISLRLGLFLTVFFIWLIKWLKSCNFSWLKDKRRTDVCCLCYRHNQGSG